jgi:hypothetical protein
MCNFSINYPRAKDELIERFRTTVEVQPGGLFKGDDTSGAFSFKAAGFNIAGNYSIEDDLIQVRVTDKPFLLSCSRIESELKRYLGV